MSTAQHRTTDIIRRDVLVDGVVRAGVPAIKMWVEEDTELDEATARAMAADLPAHADQLREIMATS